MLHPLWQVHWSAWHLMHSSFLRCPVKGAMMRSRSSTGRERKAAGSSLDAIVIVVFWGRWICGLVVADDGRVDI